jgi:hypothetical protein
VVGGGVDKAQEIASQLDKVDSAQPTSFAAASLNSRKTSPPPSANSSWRSPPIRTLP